MITIDVGVKINLENLIATRLLIQANSGGGKSYAIRKILEEAYGKVQIIVLDVEGEFKTLREKYDFVFIGRDGDVDISLKSAKLLPRKIMEFDISAIIDMSELKRNDRIQYVKQFLEALMELPRELWRPCLVVLDEAHAFMGQQEKQDSFSAVIDLMTRGRKRGFAGVLLTQRISKLHKDGCAEANNRLIGRTGLDIDMKRASEELGFTSKQDMLSLRDLEPGEFYAFGSAMSKSVRKIKIGKCKTTHPQIGQKIKYELKESKKIKSILEKLSDLPKEAEKEAKTLQDYRSEILELKKKISVKVPAHDIAQLTELQKKYRDAIGVRDMKILEFKKVFSLMNNKQLPKLYEAYSKMQELIDVQIEMGNLSPLNEEQRKKEKFEDSMTDKPKQVAFESERPGLRNATRSFRHSEVENSDIRLGICEKKIYSFLYANPGREFSKSQVGAVTGYSPKSGSFSNSLSKLKTLNLIRRKGDIIQVDNMDESLVGDFDFDKKSIIQRLGKCEKEIYEFLMENPNEEFTKEQIADSTISKYSSNSGSFSNSLSRLKTLGLIKKEGNFIMLNPELEEV